MNDLPEPQDVKHLLSQHAEHFSAPADLRSQILRDMPRAANAPKTSLWQQVFATPWLRVGSGFAAGALVASITTSALMSNVAEQQATLLALASDHTRAMMTQNTIEIRSSSMHTVKPWLSSNLGYSPEVFDLTEQGFPLIGGRRGYLGSVPVAVIVYAHKQHEVDVYALRASSAALLPQHPTVVDGFKSIAWQVGDIRYLAISDMEREPFKTFSTLLEQRQRTLQP